MVLWAFVFSAEKFKPLNHQFYMNWQSLGKSLTAKPWNNLTASEWARLDQEVRKSGYPAIHHSEQYSQKYKPAYRVVLKDIWIG